MQNNGQAIYGVYFDYNKRNQLANIYDGGWGPWFRYSYDGSGNLTKRQDLRGGVNDSLNAPTQYYDALNRPTMWENSGAGDGAFARSWQQYDSAGRMTATWRDEQSSQGERFDYNATNQLKKASYNAQNVWTGSPQNALKTQDYVYTADKLNRQSVTENGVVTPYSPNALNQYQSYNGVTYNYDYNFNLREAPNWWGVFDAESRLTMAGGGGNVVMFTYDGLGRCVKRVVYPPGGGSRMSLFTYDGWKPVMEWDGAGNCLAWNIYGSGADEILWRCQAGVGNLRYHHDVHGNVAFVLGDGGEALERYSYDAFGKPKIMDWAGNERTNGTAIGNRFLFQGREWIAELGVYDYRHRMYHPALGRFLQMDPTGFDAGDMNLFRYCDDDPVDRSDPMGTDYQVSYDPHDASHVIIVVPIVWRGGTSTQRAEFTRGLETRWTSKFSDRSYETRVVDGNKVPQEQRNYVTIHKGTGTADTKGRVGHWYEHDGGGWSREAVGGHDGGHLLGHGDRYLKTSGPFPYAPRDQDGNPIPEPGYDKNNIMVNPNGWPSRQDFNAIEHGDGRGYMGNSPSGGGGTAPRTFGAYGSPTMAAAQWEASWGTGGWLAGRR